MFPKCLYTYNIKVPQDTPLGVCLEIDNIALKEAPINDLQKYIPNLVEDVCKTDIQVQNALKFYAQTTGYEIINKQMRGINKTESNISLYVNNIFTGFHTYGFQHPVRLFRTESDDYKQEVNGKLISSRKLSVKDSWDFTSFISASVTNKPLRPKCQQGKWTVFVFEFKINEDIKGLYLDQSVGKNGEEEFLLAPAKATVSNAYKQKIGIGYFIEKVKFVVCRLDFLKSSEPGCNKFAK